MAATSFRHRAANGDAETLNEQPYDVEKNMRLFQEFGTA